jgi:hypothetical protein
MERPRTEELTACPVPPLLVQPVVLLMRMNQRLKLTLMQQKNHASTARMVKLTTECQRTFYVVHAMRSRLSRNANVDGCIAQIVTGR